MNPTLYQADSSTWYNRHAQIHVNHGVNDSPPPSILLSTFQHTNPHIAHKLDVAFFCRVDAVINFKHPQTNLGQVIWDESTTKPIGGGVKFIRWMKVRNTHVQYFPLAQITRVNI